jgi:hypothetical protein
MANPAETQAAHAEFLIELALMHLHPEPMPPQPAQPNGVIEALEKMGEAMHVLYGGRRG